jgi:O-antigen/teichoic acid export membrane protein
VLERRLALSLSDEAGRKLLSILRLLVVATILAPSEIGKFALAAAVLAAFEVTTQSGMHEALVQAPERSETRDRTVWTVLVARGFALSVVIYVAAPYIALILRQPEVREVVQVVAFAPAISGLTSLSLIYEQRCERFGRLAALRILAGLIETVGAIVLSVRWESAEALAVGLLLGTSTIAAGSYAIRGFVPVPRLALRQLVPIVGFSKWRFGSSVAHYVATAADDLALGRYLNTTAVGHYRVAYQLTNSPATSFTVAVGAVVFPALSRHERLSKGRAAALYPSYLRLSTGFSFLAIAVIALVGELVLFTLGPPWLPALPALGVLCAAVVVRVVVATGGTLFLATGSPRYDTTMQVVRATALLVSLPLILPFGATGASVAALISMLATVPPWLRGLGRVGVVPRVALEEAARRLPVPALALIAGLASRWPIESIARRTSVSILVFTMVLVVLLPRVDRTFYLEASAAVHRLVRGRAGKG